MVTSDRRGKGKIMYFSMRLRPKTLLCILAAVAAGIFFSFAAAASGGEKQEGIFVPIIMYHSILKDEAMTGQYVVTPVELEKDMIYLKENGYTAVFVNDLIRYVNSDGKLPEKPVVLTFDDGTYNNYTYLYPLLKKYDMKAVISVVGSYTLNASECGDEPNPAYSYLRWEDINEMRDSKMVEFCSHTYDMHGLGQRTGIKRMDGESYEDYRGVFMNDIFKLQQLLEENCGFRPNVFTYPFGASGESARRLVKNCGFEASMGVEEKPNYIVKGDESCLYDLNRYNRSGLENSADFMKKALAE